MLFTRLERPKRAKDEVKQAQMAQRCPGLGGFGVQGWGVWWVRTGSLYISGTSGKDFSWEPRTVGNPPLLAQITWYRDQSDLVLCWYIINWNLPVF